MNNLPKIFGHGSYIGDTGYNNHTRDFFRAISDHVNIKIRNYTVGKTWSGFNIRPHDNEQYINEIDKKILYEQILWTENKTRVNEKIYPSDKKNFEPDFHIVLAETNHHIFYDNYNGPKIAYNVWESTLQPEEFFEKLKEYDELWVPSEWQKNCTIEQGFDSNRIKVVPEGVDTDTFFPETKELSDEYKDGRFKFIVFGKWEYRKSTKEIIETFLSTFQPNEPVDLIVSVDNANGHHIDGYKTTEERLRGNGFDDERIKVLHFPTRQKYIDFLKIGHVFVSCSRAEGWNLPLIESMACGTPSIYSDCSAQLEFAKGKGLPVRIAYLRKASDNHENFPGDYYEPDFNDLSRVMRYAYENYTSVKEKALFDSEKIREDFSWKKIGEIGFDLIKKFYSKISNSEYVKPKIKNKIFVNYIDGPRVEIKGNEDEEYLVEFIDGKNGIVVHSNRIKNNMWTVCSRKYFTNWIIKVNGEIVDTFDCTNKRVLISFESKAMGDTIAWIPYVVDFAKKYNCKVSVSTFHNEWFENLEHYKDIQFIKPGQSLDVYTVFRLGWYRSDRGLWDRLDLVPNIQNTIPLQQTATDILGLPFYEMNYGIDFRVQKRPTPKKYIVFGPNATAGAKEWRYENWVKLSEMLRNLGFEIIILTKKPFHIENTKNICDKPIQEVMNYLFHSELFIGLGSGLSWLNWALGKKTAMINGFSEDGHEFTSNVIRITNNVCIKCWNDAVIPFDAGDWDWCPVYKGTTKQHICQSSITPQQVLEKIKSHIVYES